MKTQGQPVLSGTQRIGWDPLKRQFKTWIFDSEGGHGEGYWTRTGNQWVIKAEGVSQDGQPASVTNIITRLGKDRMNWQSTEQDRRRFSGRPGSTSSRSCASHPRPASKASQPYPGQSPFNEDLHHESHAFEAGPGHHSGAPFPSSDVLARSRRRLPRGPGGGYGGGGRGGYGGQMGGGSMGHSPAISQPHQQSGSPGSYGNRSQYGNQGSSNHNAGAAAAGAGYAEPQPGLAARPPGCRGCRLCQPQPGLAARPPGCRGAAAGAGYANNHNGTWNGNNYAGWGATGLGTGYASGIGAWGVGSPMYGWGYSGYSNPYYGGGFGSGGVPQTAAVQQQTAAQASDYSQPINTTAAAPEQSVAARRLRRTTRPARPSNRVTTAQALQLDQQALAQTPNDTDEHEFLALAYFAQGKYPAGRGSALRRPLGETWLGLDNVVRDVPRCRHLYQPTPGLGGLRQVEAGFGPGSLRAGLPVPVTGA